MKLKGFILIILSMVLTAAYLLPSSDNFAGVLALVLIGAAFIFSVVFKQHVIANLGMVVGMHWLELEGYFITLYILFPAILTLLFFQMRNTAWYRDKPWLLSIAIMGIYVLLILVVRPYDLRYTMFYLYGITFLFFMSVSLNKWDGRLLHIFLSIHLYFMYLWSFVEHFVSDEIRIGGPSLSATNFAALIATSWTIWHINAWLSKKADVLLLGANFVLTFICIVFTGSRMGFIGVAVGMVFSIFCYFMKNAMAERRGRIGSFAVKLCVSMAVILAVGLLVWKVLPDTLYIKQGLLVLASGKMDNSSLGRIGVWLTALDIIQHKPIWGCGPRNFLEYNKAFLETYSAIPMVAFIPRLGHAHNVYLMLLSEQGIVGFGAVSAVSALCFRELLIYIKNHWDGFGLSLLGGALVFFTLGLIDVFPLFPSTFGWGAWYMGVLFSLRFIRRKEQCESQS